MTTENCENCKFSLLEWKHFLLTEAEAEEEGYLDELICRRFPPRPEIKYYLTPSDIDPWSLQPMQTDFSYWPRVMGSNWCGEWVAAE